MRDQAAGRAEIAVIEEPQPDPAQQVLSSFNRAFDTSFRGDEWLKRIQGLDRASVRVGADLPRLEAALAILDPTLSLRVVRARVERIDDETHDTKTYWLRPNARFGTFRPGAHVTLQLRIGGRAVERTYSLSSAPRSDTASTRSVPAISQEPRSSPPQK